ncbi:MarR family winged helix-turn-helix transcriptional regulator [Acidothermaceae bacterium B102]|nr:MarR family winged helix-turn-helix transcriptional regulator [Acidothermaceae bacterium B102]
MTTCPEAEDPHWLDPAERAAWLALTGILFRLPSALDSQMQRVAGLSNFEYLVLAMLSETPTQTLRMSQLAVISNGSLSRLSHVVARLERQGYVRREQGPADGRSINAVLTDEGLAKVVATAPGHVNYVRHLVFDGLTEEQVASLEQIGRSILERIDPGAPFDPAAVARLAP